MRCIRLRVWTWMAVALCAWWAAGCAAPWGHGSPASTTSATAVSKAATASTSTVSGTATAIGAVPGPLTVAMRSPLPLKVTETAPPAQAALPPSSATAPVFTGGGVGFVAGLAGPPVPGVADAAVIAETADGGRTWDRVWTSSTAGLNLTFMGLAPGSGGFIYAAGAVGAPPGEPVLVVSGDGGATWHVVDPRLPGTPLARIAPGSQPLGGNPSPPLAQEIWRSGLLQFVSPMVGFAGFNPMQDQGGSVDEAPRVLVTRDGGRTWGWLPVPPGLTAFTGGLDFTTPSDGWVTGRAGPSCARLWHTTDGGASWTAATGCLPFALRAVTFVDALHGFAAGGNRFHNNPPFEAVLATSDGGRTWRVVDAAKQGTTGRPFVQVLFSNATDGLALEGTAPLMLQGELEWSDGLVVATRDGGRTWTRVASGVSRLVRDGPAAVWAGTLGGAALLASGDGGATWAVVARDAGLSLTSVRFLDNNAEVGWISAGGTTFLTPDGGRSWLPYPAAPSAYPQDLPWFASPQAAFTAGPPDRLFRSGDGGHSWSTVSVDAGSMGVDGVTFTGPLSGWAAAGRPHGPDALYATDDGGRTWKPAGTLPLQGARLAFGRRVWAAIGMGLAGAVAVSADRGASWAVLDLPPHMGCQSGDVAGTGIWLACTQFSTAARGGELGVILRSPDAGRHWQAYAAGPLVPRSIAMTDAQHGWMTAGPATGVDGLYRTRDGGVTWTRVWPALPGPPA